MSLHIATSQLPTPKRMASGGVRVVIRRGRRGDLPVNSGPYPFDRVHRLLAIAVFSLAATGSTLAGAGLVVAPHVDPPGTPAFHDHVLAAYRFPIFLMHLQQLYARGAKLELSTPFAASLATLAMGLLIFAWPRLPRPTRRPIAEVPISLIRRALWSAPLLLGPPRT
jgi:hypothetical protein